MFDFRAVAVRTDTSLFSGILYSSVRRNRKPISVCVCLSVCVCERERDQMTKTNIIRRIIKQGKERARSARVWVCSTTEGPIGELKPQK